MEVRDIPEIQEIGQYIRNMKLKRKLFGGCDRESVLSHLCSVTGKYEAILAKQQETLAQKNEEYDSLHSRCAELERQQAESIAMIQKQQKLLNHVKEREQLLRQQYDRLDQFIKTIEQMRGELLQKAKEEAEKEVRTIQQAIEQKRKTAAELTRQCEEQRAKLDGYTCQITQTKEKITTQLQSLLCQIDGKTKNEPPFQIVVNHEKSG